MTPKIMIVDDDQNFRRSLQQLLEDEGLDVIWAEDGFQAIQKASVNQIDLILMDIFMPGMNGVEAFSKIKEILPGCTVVMMTGFALEDLIQNALLEGAKACLIKPISIQQILEIVNEVAPQVDRRGTLEIMRSGRFRIRP